MSTGWVRSLAVGVCGTRRLKSAYKAYLGPSVGEKQEKQEKQEPPHEQCLHCRRFRREVQGGGVQGPLKGKHRCVWPESEIEAETGCY